MACIYANRKFNNTNIELVKGKSYNFSSTGMWTDLSIQTDYKGFSSNSFLLKWFESKRRMPNANWFALIGCYDKDILSSFDLSEHIMKKPYEATQSGMLFCYANDVSFMYWNNKGQINITAQEIK